MTPQMLFSVAAIACCSLYGWISAHQRAKYWNTEWRKEIRARHAAEDKYHQLILAIGREQNAKVNP